MFLVLSVESLIKDLADTIAQKASRLAQQLDLIQRTLDVRFPVYLLVTKCDLLTGFREFSDSIEDPLLQHQIFGWSNPDPLDASFRPDCLLLDISMPDLNGLEVKERLRQLGQPVPVVFITAHGQSPLRERAMAAGAVAVLQKPVREEALLEAIQNACAA